MVPARHASKIIANFTVHSSLTLPLCGEHLTSLNPSRVKNIDFADALGKHLFTAGIELYKNVNNLDYCKPLNVLVILKQF